MGTRSLINISIEVSEGSGVFKERNSNELLIRGETTGAQDKKGKKKWTRMKGKENQEAS